jgi:hypothetical protein
MDVTIGVAVRDERRERDINCLTALIALKTWVFL